MPRKKKPVNGSSDQLNDFDSVARRAYEIYERRGSRDGADLDDWLAAERELAGDVTGPAPSKAKRRKASE